MAAMRWEPSRKSELSGVGEAVRSLPRVTRLREPLERLYREFDYTARIDRDAIRFPLRYLDPAGG